MKLVPWLEKSGTTSVETLIVAEKKRTTFKGGWRGAWKDSDDCCTGFFFGDCLLEQEQLNQRNGFDLFEEGWKGSRVKVGILRSARSKEAAPPLWELLFVNDRMRAKPFKAGNVGTKAVNDLICKI